MSFVFAHNYDNANLNWLGMAICRALEFADPGHLETSKHPTYLHTYFLHWKSNGLN